MTEGWAGFGVGVLIGAILFAIFIKSCVIPDMKYDYEIVEKGCAHYKVDKYGDTTFVWGSK